MPVAAVKPEASRLFEFPFYYYYYFILLLARVFLLPILYYFYILAFYLDCVLYNIGICRQELITHNENGLYLFGWYMFLVLLLFANNNMEEKSHGKMR